jgi:hypothetical protein
VKAATVGLLLLIAVFNLWIPRSNEGIATGSSPKSPSVVVDVHKFGWAPSPEVSNRKFLSDISAAKLEGRDENTRIAFLSEDIVLLYHTKQDDSDRRTLEAFFIKTKDGSLLSTKKFAVAARRSMNDRRDSEARILPLYDGRFLVFADKALTVYDSNLSLQKQRILQPRGTGDLWSAQSVAQGHELFLRHESNSEVTYSWLNSDSLATNHEQPGYQDRDFSAKGLVNASDNAVFTLTGSSLRMITQNREVKTICDDQLCRGDGVITVLSSSYVGISTRAGIGIVNTEAGLVWSKRVESPSDPKGFDFGEIRSSASGMRFVTWAAAVKKGIFDGVKITDSPILIVYDKSNIQDRPLNISIRPASGNWDYALSPSGKKLAIFDGAKIRIYLLD